MTLFSPFSAIYVGRPTCVIVITWIQRRIWGYRSALVDVYRSKLLGFDPQLDTELHRVLESYEKVINDLKKRGLLKINEGKRQLKASGYDRPALKLLTIEP
ncbi:hypothetical protein PHPALM_31967 [Phytophthora palmivora]|uniref:Uncharacterized protein n=1 Tax=Phytophthora palmivora TaxID=4796 RepID=A0A2P4X198_9STRA|nr:hypothetical protein PHPALM_31967 [Phytophthora palmivora]